ncbi:MAG: endonuclease Q family protein [Candidatus Omnitrophica bacterium]|nr:endonuclease Q family protein [Candidatus Omnitrophota bacterium]
MSKFYADLHIHSKYSRATSKSLDFEALYLWAQLKGLQVVGSGDFLHPAWFKEITTKLEEAEPGFFKLKEKYAKEIDKDVPKSCRGKVRFVLSVEISSIYKKMDKVRKIHNVVLAPHLKSAEKIQKKLGAIGNICSDGRPILGLDSRDLLEITLEADDKAFLVPAHIWTPWFALLGSKSGFDRVEDCFGDLTKHVFALETGLSSDPLMNWRLSRLDDYVLISNSDAHSASKLARESNIFDTEFSYNGMYKALKDPKDKGFLGTIEFFPEEGKYHYDGHRDCKICLTPKKTIKNKGLCPVCGKSVTVGVMARVEELADRKQGEKSKRWRPYHSLIPLVEVVAEARGMGPNSKAVQKIFHAMLNALGGEISILWDKPIKDIQVCAGDVVAEGVSRMRQGKVNIAPGYDGEYGVVKLFSDAERAKLAKQPSLF